MSTSEAEEVSMMSLLEQSLREFISEHKFRPTTIYLGRDQVAYLQRQPSFLLQQGDITKKTFYGMKIFIVQETDHIGYGIQTYG